MKVSRALAVGLALAAGAAIVAGCTSSSDGTGTPSATTTVTATDTVSSANPPTGSGGPATSTAPAGASSSGSTAEASGPGLCTPTVMTFDVTRNDGAAGSSYFLIHATNASSSACVTTGYPGIAFLDAAGRQILQADRGDPAKSTTIVVAPGAEITAQVRAESTDAAHGGTPCPSSPAFLLTLPDNTDSTKITHTTPACSVGVEAFVKGAGDI